MEPWNLGSLEPWNPGTLESLEPWNPNHGTLESGSLQRWNFGNLELWNLEPSNPAALEPGTATWSPPTLQPWNPGTLEPWNLENVNDRTVNARTEYSQQQYDCLVSISGSETGALSGCRTQKPEHWNAGNPGILQPWNSERMNRCNPETVEHCNSGTLERLCWSGGALEFWKPGPWHATLKAWNL